MEKRKSVLLAFSFSGKEKNMMWDLQRTWQEHIETYMARQQDRPHFGPTGRGTGREEGSKKEGKEVEVTRYMA